MAYDCQDTINQQRQCLAFLWNSGIVLKVITEEISLLVSGLFSFSISFVIQS